TSPGGTAPTRSSEHRPLDVRFPLGTSARALEPLSLGLLVPEEREVVSEEPDVRLVRQLLELDDPAEGESFQLAIDAGGRDVQVPGDLRGGDRIHVEEVPQDSLVESSVEHLNGHRSAK